MLPDPFFNFYYKRKDLFWPEIGQNLPISLRVLN